MALLLLPKEIAIVLLSFLNVGDVLSVKASCQPLSILISEHAGLWKKMLLEDFGMSEYDPSFDTAENPFFCQYKEKYMCHECNGLAVKLECKRQEVSPSDYEHNSIHLPYSFWRCASITQVVGKVTFTITLINRAEAPLQVRCLGPSAEVMNAGTIFKRAPPYGLEMAYTREEINPKYVGPGRAATGDPFMHKLEANEKKQFSFDALLVELSDSFFRGSNIKLCVLFSDEYAFWVENPVDPIRLFVRFNYADEEVDLPAIGENVWKGRVTSAWVNVGPIASYN